MTKIIYLFLLLISISCNTQKQTAVENAKTNTTANSDCPTNFILIPGGGDAGSVSSSFCVSKFEMRPLLDSNDSLMANSNNGGTPIDPSLYYASSRPDGYPWLRISTDEAITECQNLGYELLSNSQWQTIARNIELVSSNWEGSKLYTGHSDGAIDGAATCPDGSPLSYDGKSILSACDASDTYIGTGQSNSDNFGSGKEQRRTFTLSNNEVIWDFSGNAREWVDVDGEGSSVTYTGPGSTGYYDLTSTEVVNMAFDGSEDLTLSMIRPVDATLNHLNNNTGKFYIKSGARSGRAISRGGNFSAGNKPGIYAGDLDSPMDYKSSSATFRCVKSI